MGYRSVTYKGFVFALGCHDEPLHGIRRCDAVVLCERRDQLLVSRDHAALNALVGQGRLAHHEHLIGIACEGGHQP